MTESKERPQKRERRVLSLPYGMDAQRVAAALTLHCTDRNREQRRALLAQYKREGHLEVDLPVAEG